MLLTSQSRYGDLKKLVESVNLRIKKGRFHPAPALPYLGEA